ncbi:MAG: hypothetical protein HZC28_01980 [Spirochaetes bacterium]|nr:hypothetical protein [Spirochaetota bacterium]
MKIEVTRFREPFYILYLEVIVGVVGFLLLFFVFLTHSIDEEFRMVSAWTKTASGGNQMERDENITVKGDFYINRITLREQFVHYFEKNGDTTLFLNLRRGEFATCGRDSFIVYERYGEKITCYGLDRRPMWVRETKTYPDFAPAASVIVLRTSENMSFSLLDNNNNELSTPVRAGEFITDSGFSRYTGDFAAGYINGQFCYVYRTGKMSFLTSAILSEKNVVKGIALSEYGNFVGVVSGLRPEYISVYSAAGKLRWYKPTGQARRRASSIVMSEKYNTMLTLTDYGVLFYDLASGAVKAQYQFNDAAMEFSSYMKADVFGQFAFVGIAKQGLSRILLIDHKNNNILWQTTFDSWVYDVAFSSRGDEYLVTTDKFIYCYKRIQL